MQGVFKGISVKAGKGILSDPISTAKFEVELEPAEVRQLIYQVGKLFKIEPTERPLPLVVEAEDILEGR